MKDQRVVFTLVTVIIGFMLAIQFQTTNEPVVRDTRSILELREELKIEQERQSQLLQEIDNHKTQLYKYESEQEENLNLVILEAIKGLREEAGLTEVSREGIRLTIEAEGNGRFITDGRQAVTPELLRFLVNELNIYGAKEIAIANQRVVGTSAFRDVNGVTHVNGRRIPPLPLEIKVLTADAELLHNEMVVSQSADYFAIENLRLSSEPVNQLTLPAYNQTLRVRYMEQVKEDS